MSDSKNDDILYSDSRIVLEKQNQPYKVHPITKQLLFREVRTKKFEKNGIEISFPIPGWYAPNSDVFILEKEDKILVERIKGLL